MVVNQFKGRFSHRCLYKKTRKSTGMWHVFHFDPFFCSLRRSFSKWMMNEFFLNECHWTQQIQWIMRKSKNNIVTTNTIYLDIVTFPVIIMESTFSLLPLGRFLCKQPNWIDIYPGMVVKISFSLLHLRI